MARYIPTVPNCEQQYLPRHNAAACQRKYRRYKDGQEIARLRARAGLLEASKSLETFLLSESSQVHGGTRVREATEPHEADSSGVPGASGSTAEGDTDVMANGEDPIATNEIAVRAKGFHETIE